MAEIVWKSTRCRRSFTAWLAGFAFCGAARILVSVEDRLSPGLNIATRFAAAGAALSDNSFELRRKRVAMFTTDAAPAMSPSEPLRDLAELRSLPAAAGAEASARSFEPRRKRAPTLRAAPASPALDMP